VIHDISNTVAAGVVIALEEISVVWWFLSSSGSCSSMWGGGGEGLSSRSGARDLPSVEASFWTVLL
jgi:hypothetical protein